MSVLARNRSLSKLEFYMNAVKLRRQLIFLMGRDFGVKPRIREPRFCTRKWEPHKAFLRGLLKDIEDLAKRLGIHINEKKTQIVKLSHGFTWLKTRYILTDTGKIIKKIPKDVTKRERRKLKKLAQKVKAGDMTAEDYDNQYRAWRGDKKRYNAYKTLKSMDLYKRRQSSWTKSKEKS